MEEKKETTLDLIDSVYYSSNIPAPVPNEIQRDGLIDTISRFPEDIVFVEGEPDSGKSILLAQFARKYNLECISCFINPINSYSVREDVVWYDIINQMYLLVEKKELPTNLDINLKLLSSYSLKLQRQVKRSKNTFYFILDGFHNLKEDHTSLFLNLIDQLPIGISGFKAIISDQQKALLNLVKTTYSSIKQHDITTFSLDETIKFLSDLTLDRNECIEIKELTRGLPGRIMNIKNVLKQGISYKSFSQNIFNYTDVFEYEWQQVNQSDEILMKVLGIITYGSFELTLELIADFCESNVEEIKVKLNSLPFFKLAENSIELTSNHYKRLLEVKLQPIKNKITDLILGFLYNGENATKFQVEIANILFESKRYPELINYLTEDKYEGIILKSESFSLLDQQTKLGFEAAIHLGQDKDIFKFSLQRAILQELESAEAWESEVIAEVELGEYNQALELIHSVLAHEDKLILFSLYLREKKEKGLALDVDICETIKILSSKVDYKVLGERIYEVAANLLYTMPELALQIIDNVNEDGDKSNRDIGLVRLSILVTELRKDKEGYTNINEQLNSKIKDPKLKNLSRSIAKLYKNYNAKDILREIKRIKKVQDQISLLRVWLENADDMEGLEFIIKFSLDLLIKASTNIPVSASLLKEISTPLHRSQNLTTLENLLSEFDSFLGLAREKGPTIDYVKFELNLAKAEYKIDIQKARNRFQDIFREITSQTDVALKSECLAVLYYTTTEVDKDRLLETQDKLLSKSEELLMESINSILRKTADHYKLLESTIKILATCHLDLALLVCENLNIEVRRNNAYLTTLKSYLSSNSLSIDLKKIPSILGKITMKDVQDRAFMAMLYRLNDREEIFSEPNDEINFYIARTEEMDSSVSRCLCFLDLVSIIDKNNIKPLTNVVITKLKQSWQAIDYGVDKIEMGFRIASDLGKYDKTTALWYLNESKTEKKATLLNSPTTTTIYLNNILLLIRSFSGLVKGYDNLEEEIEDIISLIKDVPTSIEQVFLVNNLLLRIYNKGNDTLFKSTAERHLVKRLYSILEDSSISNKDKLELIENSCESVFLINATLLYSVMEKYFDAHERDSILDKVIEFLFTKHIPSDTYDSKDLPEGDLSYNEVLTIIEVLRHVNTDALITEIIKKLHRFLKKVRLTKEQYISVRLKLLDIIDSKLPDRRNIAHDGFKLVCTFYIYSLTRTFDELDISHIINRINSIANSSDKALIFIELAYAIGDSSAKAITRNSVVQMCLKEIENIPSAWDRVHRINDIMPEMREINLSLCKEQMQKAISSSINEFSIPVFELQKSIIDFAFDIDANFAEELAKIIDNDPGRKPISKRIGKELSFLKVQQKLIKEFDSIPKIQDIDVLCHAIRGLLGKLNSGRRSHVHLDIARNLLIVGNRVKISQSYPCFAYYIMNAISRLEGSKDGKNYIKNLYDVMYMNTKLIKVLSTKRQDKNLNASLLLNQDHHYDSLIIKPGERDRAIEIIRNWVKDSCFGYVKICDPYFSADDLEIIKVIFDENRQLEISILTGLTHNRNIFDVQQEYNSSWKLVSDEEPPLATIYLVTTKRYNSNLLKTPNHDRYMISEKSGIRFGTSLNSLGLSQNSELSFLSEDEASEIEETLINPYLSRREKYFNEEKIYYNTFDLGYGF